LDNNRHKEPLIFSGTVEEAESGDVLLTVTREDGMRKAWQFPRTKLAMFRSLGGELNIAIRFMRGEDV
jgi:hypothetical protein